MSVSTSDVNQPAVDSMHQRIGERIREARRGRGMSLTTLGGEELSRSFLSLVERGQTRISLRSLAIVANRLQLPITHFLNEEEPERRSETRSAGHEASWSINVRQSGPNRLVIEVTASGDITLEQISADSTPLDR